MALGNYTAPDEQLESAYRTLARDRARLGTTGYPVYKGLSTAPQSTLTQRANTLRNEFAAKAPPYTKKIERVLGRNNEGLSQQDIQGLLGQLGQSQRTFGQGPILDTLKKQFLSSYTPREGRFGQKIEADIGRQSPESEGRLQDIRRAAGTLEASRNRQIAGTLQGLQKDKLARREGLVGSLEQFGAQKHAHTNMVNQANRNQFNLEAAEPYRKMEMLERSLSPHRSGYGQEMHPDLAGAHSANIAQAQRAYNTTSGSYPGQLVAPLPPEITASHSVLEGLKPNLRDSYTDKRKELTRGLVGNDNLSAAALQNLPPALRGQVSQLENQGSHAMKKDLASLTNKYIRLGQYGSRQHIGSAEGRGQEISRGVLEARDKLLRDALAQQLQLQHGNEIGNIKQLGQIGQQSHNDYGNLLKNVRELNQTGATKFANNQAENEDMYKNYQNERAWQFPHMREAGAQGGASSGGFGSAAALIVPDRNLSLENLHNLNTSYSNLEKERSAQPSPQITSMQQAMQQMQHSQAQAERQSQMQEQQRAQMQAQQRAQMEAQRQAEEQQRLEKQQGMGVKENQWERFRNHPGFQQDPIWKAYHTMQTPGIGDLNAAKQKFWQRNGW